MSTNQETARSTIKTAEAVKVDALVAATVAHQGAIAVATTNVGYYSGKGGAGEATYQTAVVTANAAKRDAIIAAERAKQAAVHNAKDLLRSQNEIL